VLNAEHFVRLQCGRANGRSQLTGDYNADGTSDILWQDTSGKTWRCGRLNGTSVLNGEQLVRFLTSPASGRSRISAPSNKHDADNLRKTAERSPSTWWRSAKPTRLDPTFLQALACFSEPPLERQRVRQRLKSERLDLAQQRVAHAKSVALRLGAQRKPAARAG